MRGKEGYLLSYLRRGEKGREIRIKDIRKYRK